MDLVVVEVIDSDIVAVIIRLAAVRIIRSLECSMGVAGCKVNK